MPLSFDFPIQIQVSHEPITLQLKHLQNEYTILHLANEDCYCTLIYLWKFDSFGQKSFQSFVIRASCLLELNTRNISI